MPHWSCSLLLRSAVARCNGERSAAPWRGYLLKQLAIRFELPAQTYGYSVETSNDDALYTVQRTLSGTGAIQQIDFPPDVSARYVRVTITTVTNKNWACVWDFALSGI